MMGRYETSVHSVWRFWTWFSLGLAIGYSHEDRTDCIYEGIEGDTTRRRSSVAWPRSLRTTNMGWRLSNSFVITIDSGVHIYGNLCRLSKVNKSWCRVFSH